MPYTLDDFKRDYLKEQFAKFPPEEQREAFQALPPEQQREVFQALPPEQQREFLRSLPPDVLQFLPLEQRLAGLSAEQIRGYLDRLSAAPPAKPRKSRKKK